MDVPRRAGEHGGDSLVVSVSRSMEESETLVCKLCGQKAVEEGGGDMLQKL